MARSQCVISALACGISIASEDDVTDDCVVRTPQRNVLPKTGTAAMTICENVRVGTNSIDNNHIRLEEHAPDTAGIANATSMKFSLTSDREGRRSSF